MPTWLNGVRADNDITEFNLTDKGLLLGYGVFDTALIVENRVIYREAHLERLITSCAALSLPVSAFELGKAMDIGNADIALGSVRVTVTAGKGPRGLSLPTEIKPNIIVSKAMITPEIFCPELRLLPSETRRNETSPTARIKTLNYLDAVLAVRHARYKGYDDVLFLNTKDRVACSSMANLFMIREGRLITPPVSEGVLPGIMRATVLRLAAANNIPTEERPILFSELLKADDVFLTNSLRMICQVTQIGDILMPRRFQALLALIITKLYEDMHYTR
ncbi:MAG: aminotransferase class IV [Zymomonas mobilis subsp. pomaceae]|uniref:Probable branched-chain-amino-acid aminotransferase n=1 Tax=Zymomonas mobilis subsp. pomaceae (strain ATCC 29192 / DSM 22645 / JCM 10191 / CCUG 17912 / NBRC 13757 / NCIMB 11200 / NRRL B-4491 / Barker I) TaxID=579138 RepID=F8ETT2_ZYMMT|nr:aminotransferase class IV [Zymomonas mobilis]AEI38029.1 aminotransferase class IV [Zymomonas mobilis subsp. pomaceae ATCC 29192]MDX5949396.1 aminotransferase class IV [Zymomonas mobilis subsp. pomaceae]GEB89139.1 2-keto-4-methylthiobutyrate aminotransferase [Zymomonas mobilis subsp. pomaceae]